MKVELEATQQETHANALGIGVKRNTWILKFELQKVWHPTNRSGIPKIRVVALVNVRKCLHENGRVQPR